MKSPFKIAEVDGNDNRDILYRLQNLCLPDATVWPVDGTFWWLARNEDQTPVGFAGLYVTDHDHGVAELCRGGVLATARGHGLQRSLIRHRERKARELGMTRITSYTVAENPWSMTNLIDCGFRPYAPPKGWALEGCVYWQKSLFP
jgi:GNAT superfamily N-acetyltransferase